MSSPAVHGANKRLAGRLLTSLAEASPAEIGRHVADAYHPDAQWRGDGASSATGGGPGVVARHTGGDFTGVRRAARSACG